MRQLTKYFLWTYLVSWACFISVVVLSHGPSVSSPVIGALQYFLIFTGVISPSLVALWLSTHEGRPGRAKQLLSRIVRWKVNIKWYVFAAGFMAVVKLLVALSYKIIKGSWPTFGQEAWYIMVIAILFSTWVQAGEEIGWRGFALPKMTEKFGFPGAALVLGIIWSFWHLPLFFVRGANTFGQSFPLYVLQVTALSIVLGWLYWRANGSLLLTMVLHAAVNNTKDIVPSAVAEATNPFAWSDSLVAWLTVVFLWIFATYCLVRMWNIKQLDSIEG